MTSYLDHLLSLPPKELDKFIEAFEKSIIGKLHALQEEAQTYRHANDAEQVYYWGIKHILDTHGKDE